MTKIAIVIPARYASSRLPGKPLAMIAGQTMLHRVVRLAQNAAHGLDNVSVSVATDDERIALHCNEIDVDFIMTETTLATGTDRVAQAVEKMNDKPEFILNLQGDAPFTPPDFLRALIDSFTSSPCDCVTPVTQLSWQALDILRKNKLTTPFSGTTAIFDNRTGYARWFSKNIIPAIRNEHKLRDAFAISPVFCHIGLYGYSYDMLTTYVQLPKSHFENLEELEQLRLIENDYNIRCVPVDYNGRMSMSGIDSPEDILRAEALLKEYGDNLF